MRGGILNQLAPLSSFIKVFSERLKTVVLSIAYLELGTAGSTRRGISSARVRRTANIWQGAASRLIRPQTCDRTEHTRCQLSQHLVCRGWKNTPTCGAAAATFYRWKLIPIDPSAGVLRFFLSGVYHFGWERFDLRPRHSSAVTRSASFDIRRFIYRRVERAMRFADGGGLNRRGWQPTSGFWWPAFALEITRREEVIAIHVWQLQYFDVRLLKIFSRGASIGMMGV